MKYDAANLLTSLFGLADQTPPPASTDPAPAAVKLHDQQVSMPPADGDQDEFDTWVLRPDGCGRLGWEAPNLPESCRWWTDPEVCRWMNEPR